MGISKICGIADKIVAGYTADSLVRHILHDDDIPSSVIIDFGLDAPDGKIKLEALKFCITSGYADINDFRDISTDGERITKMVHKCPNLPSIFRNLKFKTSWDMLKAASIKNVIATNKILKVGDDVMWRADYGKSQPVKVRVKNIDITENADSSNGTSVKAVHWTMKDFIVVDLANGKWAYGYQISPIE